MVFSADDDPATTTEHRTASDDDAADENTVELTSQQSAMVDMIMDGKGEAVYVGTIIDDEFVSALVTNEYERPWAASLIEGATAGIAVFVSGVVSDVEKFTREGGVSTLLDEMNADVFDRFEHVGVPATPRDIRDPETRVVMAAHSAVNGRRGGGPMLG